MHVCQQAGMCAHYRSILEEPAGHLEVTWKQSFTVRFAVVWALVLGSAVGLSGWLSHRDARHQVLGNLNETVEQDARVVELRVKTWLETLVDDTRSASRSPLVAEFLKTRGTADETKWRELVEAGFRGVFAGKPTYIQMRLLEVGGVNEGREIVRLNREGEDLVVASQNQLQEKGGRNYFGEALTVPKGEVYLSEINLNRDFGKLTVPRLPTVRTAIRIGNETRGEVMLIINVDLRFLFEELRKLASDEAEIYLGDEKDDYLMHVDEEVSFASDLGHGVHFDPKMGEGGVVAARNIEMGRWPKRRLFLRVALADESWRPVLAQSFSRGLWTTILASLGGAGLALVIAWFFARRLGRLTKALRRFDGKEEVKEAALVDSRRDEIGVAIARFEEMAGKVREHVEELHRAREEAVEAEAAKENFLAVMSHEIRTPMNAVVGLVSALESNDPSPCQGPILSSLRSSTNNLMTLLNTALDYTRLHEGAMRYEKRRLDVAELANEVVDELKPSAMSKGLSLELKVPGELWVVGDAVRLRQVLNNLLNNALKFTPKGFVKLEVRHERSQLVGEVRDSGPGIPKEDEEKIFTPFYSRVDEQESHEIGAGLGLSVSHEMLKQQGGSLSLDCPPEGGALFRFILPYPKSEERREDGRTQQAAIPKFGKGKQILYVEDTRSNQEVMELTLAESGLEMTCVVTGAEALEMASKRDFDLLLVDLQLPDGSGIEWAREIKKTKPTVPVILVTAQASAKNQTLEEGGVISEVILKPYTKDAVLEVLEKYLSADFSEALRQVHPDNPEKAARLARCMVQEFREAAQTLLAENPSITAEVVAGIRHQFITALARFPMSEVELAFDRLNEADHIRKADLLILAQALEGAAERVEAEK